MRLFAKKVDVFLLNIQSTYFKLTYIECIKTPNHLAGCFQGSIPDWDSPEK